MEGEKVYNPQTVAYQYKMLSQGRTKEEKS
jgi:hypothetical protein